MKALNLYRLFASVLLTTTTLCAHADYVSLTVKEQSGTWTSFGLKGLVVKFSADKITVSNTEMTQTYPISDVYSLLFTDLPTAITDANQDNSRKIVSLESGRIYINAKPGTLARVYDSCGKLCTTARIAQEGSPVIIGNLQPGIYIIRAGRESCKILVK